jgi:hypothetical protein
LKPTSRERFSSPVWLHCPAISLCSCPRPRQAFYHLSHSISPFFMLGIFKIGAQELFTQAGFEPQSF